MNIKLKDVVQAACDEVNAALLRYYCWTKLVGIGLSFFTSMCPLHKVLWIHCEPLYLQEMSFLLFCPSTILSSWETRTYHFPSVTAPFWPCGMTLTHSAESLFPTFEDIPFPLSRVILSNIVRCAFHLFTVNPFYSFNWLGFGMLVLNCICLSVNSVEKQ